VARQRGTSGKQVGSNGGSGAVGVTSRGEPGAEAEGELEAGGVPLTGRSSPPLAMFSRTRHNKGRSSFPSLIIIYIKLVIIDFPPKAGAAGPEPKLGRAKPEPSNWAWLVDS